MRVMVIVKATKDSEAGVMPSKELVTAMGNYNEELVKAGIMLAGDGLKPSSQRSFRRDQGTHRRVLDVAGAVHGGGCRVAETLPESHARRI